MNTDRLIRLPELQKIVGLKHSEIYRRIGAGEFPAGVKLGERARAWRSSEIQAYIAALPTAKRAQ